VGVSSEHPEIITNANNTIVKNTVLNIDSKFKLRLTTKCGFRFYGLNVEAK